MTWNANYWWLLLLFALMLVLPAPAIIALVLTTGAVAAGARMGVALHSWIARRGGPWPIVVPIAVILVTPIAACALVLLLYVVSPWDVAWTVLLLGAATLFFTVAGPLPVVPLLVATVLAGVMLEVLSRSLLPDPMAFPPTEDALLRSNWYDQTAKCQSLFPSEQPEWVRERLQSGLSAAERVLHVGDSMVDGALQGDFRSFVDLLSRRREGTHHFNVGTGGTAADHHLAAVQNLLAVVRPSLVVQYVFDNDVYEVDRPISCCGGKPPFVRQGGELRLSCTTEDWRLSRGSLIEARAPLFWRQASKVSVTARHVLDAFAAATSRQRKMTARPDVLREFLAAMRAHLQSHGVDHLVVVIPYRPHIEEVIAAGGSEPHDGHVRLLEIVRQAGMVPLDGWQIIFDAARRRVPRLWTLRGGPRDPHFDVAGHRLFADWLGPQIEAILDAADERAAPPQ